MGAVDMFRTVRMTNLLIFFLDRTRTRTRTNYFFCKDTHD